MASGPVVGEGGGDGSRPKQRWVESKVYTRKAYRGQRNNSNKNTSSSNNNDVSNVNTTTIDNENSSNNKKIEDKVQDPLQQLAAEADAASEDSSSLNRAQLAATSYLDLPPGNGSLPRLENRVKFDLSSRSKREMRELRTKLEFELDMVRQMVKKIEDKEVQIRAGSNQSLVVTAVENGVANRVHSEVASVGHHETSRGFNPSNHLRIPAIETNQIVCDNVEKEKRTPKANPMYKNSEFLLGKERLPMAESNKKSKVQVGFRSGLNKYFKSCSSFLERLMKHKHGWVFNTPVDVEGLGLHDYYSIVKYPMDLGTVKKKLNSNCYKSPMDFAQDVRRTFDNAMLYNPEGQDVHTMAEQLSKIFEERWAIIEADYMRELRSPMDFDVGLPTPSSRKTHPVPPPPPLEVRQMVDRSDFVTNAYDPKVKPMGLILGKAAAPKKPKARDPHKRDMTFEEKHKLSTNLQSLPTEKLDQIVQIIKKRNSAFSQHDDEIEVDIDRVDTETLWELDRFVTNYKKVLSKNKRKASLANQARVESMQSMQEHVAAPNVCEGFEENATGIQTTYVDASNRPPNQVSDNDGSGSSSSTSSSSDSGSSSSESDSESSSEDGSDTGQ